MGIVNQQTNFIMTQAAPGEPCHEYLWHAGLLFSIPQAVFYKVSLVYLIPSTASCQGRSEHYLKGWITQEPLILKLVTLVRLVSVDGNLVPLINLVGLLEGLQKLCTAWLGTN